MDYIFNEDIFKKNFNFQELGEDGSGTDALRLRHNPDKNFRLFPYKVNKNERYFVRDISEVVSDFLKLVMGIKYLSLKRLSIKCFLGMGSFWPKI